MARLARLVVPGFPHHVTKRGNRRERIFFSDEDHQFYLDELAAAARKAKSEIWAWCLMPNHVHLLIMPNNEDGLRQTVVKAHRRYAAWFNARNKWTGHVWQGRCGSVVVDEAHLCHAWVYACLNPVRARLVLAAQDWQRSSARAHLSGQPDGVTTLVPAQQRIDDFAAYLDKASQSADFAPLRGAEITERPIGDLAFLAGLEAETARGLKAGKRGPKTNRSAAH